MKKLVKIILILLVLSILIITVSYSFSENDEKSLEIEKDKYQEQMEKMTLREKIGQMFVIVYRDTLVNDELRNIIHEVKPGGFIMMPENYSTFDDTKKFIDEIKSLTEIPLFIATDEEGGKVQRLLSLTDIKPTDIPSMNEIGKINNEKLSYQIGKIIGEEVRTLGINNVYAPVLDIGDSKTSSMKNRVFSSDANIVLRNGIQVAKGISDSDVLPVYKHFPGIGDTVNDSHLVLPIVDKTKEELYQKELIPFIEAIKTNAEMIMVGHINYPKVSNDSLPASLSKTIINDLLKEELGYKGLVITDALNMHALDEYTEEEVYKLGLEAGVDIFLMPEDPILGVNIIEKLVLNGEVKEEKINNIVVKILKLKDKYLTNFTSLPKNYLGSIEHQNILKMYGLHNK